jgi:hypothetical protein
VEEEKLQQHVNKDNGKELFQKLFEKLVCNVIPQHPRSKTKTMIKQKGKAPIK